MKAHGKYPSVLFRSFDQLEYAQQFLSGHIRFGSVLSYRKIEGQRKDNTEGTGHYSVSGSNIKIEFCSNKIYAMCCHLDLESARTTNHGKYIVKINNPLYLAKELTKTLKNSKSKHFGGIEGVQIDYNKGDEKDTRLAPDSETRLAYSQKPKNFSHEREFRFIFIRKDYAGDNITLNLDGGIDNGAIYR